MGMAIVGATIMLLGIVFGVGIARGMKGNSDG